MNGARARVIRIRVRVHVRAMHWGIDLGYRG